MNTRRPPIMEVYEDYDASLFSSEHNDVETKLLNALGPMSNASNGIDLSLHPTIPSSHGASPRKAHSSPHQPVNSYTLANFRLSPPQPHMLMGSPTKRLDFGPMYYHAPVKSLYTTHLSMDKENTYDSVGFNDMPLPPYDKMAHEYKAPMKRTFIELGGADIHQYKRQRTEEEETFDLPDPKDMPTVVDDGSKPHHSYATLIGMAILRAPHRRLTLAQIYKWISENYSFYRLADAGWQNSIRHNLSLNKNFIKRERPKDDPGKGNYWAIKPGQEKVYIADRKTAMHRMTDAAGSHYVHAFPPPVSHFTLAPNPCKKLEAKPIDSSRFPVDEPELLSDGTIPASDAGINEDDPVALDDSSMMPPPPAPMRSSSPPQEFGSSPPAVPAALQRRGTPPPAPRFPSTSRSGGRKHKFTTLNDSGYWSSIESSAARGAAHQLTSEADLPRSRAKKGRAEDEIARIRSSSFDSPSKVHRRAPSTQLASSSPVHAEDQPLTPGLVFKRPPKPPPSISPNTNLKAHRDRIKALLGSPIKTHSPGPEVMWSPAFHTYEEIHANATPGISPLKHARTPWRVFGGTPHHVSALANTTFDVFADAHEEDLTSRGSPEKRLTKRPSLLRAATSTGILADVTGTSKANNAGLTPADESPFSISPFLVKPAYLQTPADLGSPLKQVTTLSASRKSAALFKLDSGLENVRPADLMAKQSENAHALEPEFRSDSSEEMIDIFQDFGKIGQAKLAPPPFAKSNGSPYKRSAPPAMSRPTLARSNTSRW